MTHETSYQEARRLAVGLRDEIAPGASLVALTKKWNAAKEAKGLAVIVPIVPPEALVEEGVVSDE